MASTYSTNLRIEKMADGENSTTWGSKTNTNWDLIEQAVSGVASVAMTDADYTLTTSNALADEARNAVVTMTGTLTQARNVIVPSVDKQYVFKNSTTGGFSIVVKTAAGTGVTVPNGETVQVYCDATNVLLAETGGATTTILVGGGVGSVPVWTTATGSGAPVRATSPTLVTPVLGAATGTSLALGGGTALTTTNRTGTGNLVLATSPTLVTPDIGVATATSVNGVAITNNSETDTIGIGTGVLTDITFSDSRNVAIGTSALSTVTGATNVAQNVAVGYRAMATVGGGVQESVAVGYIALGAAELTGVGNTAVGYGAARALTSGARNTVVGNNAASTFATGSNSTCIGYNSSPSSTSVSNEITLGNSSIATLRCQVTSITALSDARDKTDVAPLPSGIETVMALNPVRFTWNMRDGGKVGIKDAGFIAQDLQTVDDDWLRLVYAENPEKLEASYGRLIPVLVKAIQELQQQINELKGAIP